MLLVYALLLLLAASLFHVYRWRRSLPPGPLLPRSLILGNLADLARGERYEPQLLEWAKKYGPVFTFFMGPRACVVVTKPELIVRLHSADASLACLSIFAFKIRLDAKLRQ